MDNSRAKAIIAHKEARKVLLAAGLIGSKVFLRPVKPQTAALLKELERQGKGMELRWLVEHSEEWYEHSDTPRKVTSEPRLQSRHREPYTFAGNLFFKEWSDWIDVPTVHIDI